MQITDVQVVPISDEGPFFKAKLNGLDIKVSYPKYQSDKGDHFHPFMVWALAYLGGKELENASNTRNIGRMEKRECPVHPNWPQFIMVVEAPRAILGTLIDAIQVGAGRYLWGSV
jgi:hypothetical protein